MFTQPLKLSEIGDRLNLLELQNARLERQNRWMKVGGVGLFLAFGLIMCVGAVQPPTSVKASKFVVVDSTGRTRAELDSLGLRLMDVTGKSWARLGLTEMGAGLFFIARNRQRIALSFLDDSLLNQENFGSPVRSQDNEFTQLSMGDSFGHTITMQVSQQTPRLSVTARRGTAFLEAHDQKDPVIGRVRFPGPGQFSEALPIQ